MKSAMIGPNPLSEICGKLHPDKLLEENNPTLFFYLRKNENQ